MKFYIVDAFTDELFGGNPAGVVILPENEPFPSESVMRKTAAELRYSETAFVRKLSDQRFQTRYFTPIEEVNLCGHATIATFLSLLHEGLITENSIYWNDTLAGQLSIHIQDQTVWMNMATPKALGVIKEEKALEEIYGVMGISYHTSKTDLYPELISTGIPDIMLPVASKEILDHINPDFPALSALSQKYQVVGVHAFTLSEQTAKSSTEDQPTAHCRNFAPLYGINEEAATGTSNGALTYFFYKNGMLKEGMESVFIQGESMNRPSKIKTKLECSMATSDSESELQIQVGGTGVILAQGEIYI